MEGTLADWWNMLAQAGETAEVAGGFLGEEE